MDNKQINNSRHPPPIVGHHQMKRDTSKLLDLCLRCHHHHHRHHHHHNQHHNHFQMHKSGIRTTLIILLTVALLSSEQAFTICQAFQLTTLGNPAAASPQQQEPFPGVSRDLAAFCAGRPSLPIDLASMVVHVKKDVSFNYKLYLFSGDNVFQTGQVIPRDDFRIHSFPVKFKPLAEFWKQKIDTFAYAADDQRLQESPIQVPSETFDIKQFLRPVPLISGITTDELGMDHRPQVAISATRSSKELHDEALPGDPIPPAFISHDVARVMEHREWIASGAGDTQPYNENYNRHIEFDRDDQVSVSKNVHSVVRRDERAETSGPPSSADGDEMVRPVGAFSSFHVNFTYFVRKDFGQTEPQLIRVQIDAAQFKVTRLVIISDGIKNSTSYPQNEDYAFLQHRLIRDPNTRITAINQIYEDWITRNFYTIVYIQRKLPNPTAAETSANEPDAALSDRGAASNQERSNRRQQVIVTDRLVFRGTSLALLGTEQLDYNVKAAAFIMEKNGLHYYLEFLAARKFYLCAVDWTRRPFKMIDSRGFPIKATKTQLDNEELLLCPPAICYSDRPVDEIVGYGRVSLDNDRTPGGGSNATTISAQIGAERGALIRSTVGTTDLPLRSVVAAEKVWNNTGNMLRWQAAVSAGRLETRLHLRDWVWMLPRRVPVSTVNQLWHKQLPLLKRSNKPPTKYDANSSSNVGVGGGEPAFEWRYELAYRNNVKVKQDTYGYVLTGHEIDASYRVYNELYLISANHLITINYTLANETVTSSQLLGDEFSGLSSTLIDPITGAFYDRFQNQVFFFKGDRYIGYNYATKKPLDDFLLDASLGSMELNPVDVNLFSGGPLVSSLPVVGILGRQHEIDGVYHDLASDIVYVFSGMKFYKFLASEFKNGTFKPASKSLPQMQCINEHFIQGCHFDRVYPNPCKADESSSMHASHYQKAAPSVGDQGGSIDKQIVTSNEIGGDTGGPSHKLDFYAQQQMNLRAIAARKHGFVMSALMENSLLNKAHDAMMVSGDELADKNPVSAKMEATSHSLPSKDTAAGYLLIFMIALTFLVTLLQIVMLINRFRSKASSPSYVAHQTTSPVFAASSHYLRNQRQHHRSLNDIQQGANGGGNERLACSKPLSSVKVVTNDKNRSSRSYNQITDSSAL